MAKKSSVSVLANATPKSMPFADCNESCSVSVRKIDNGFLKCESGYKGNKYYSTEVFSREKPELDAARNTNAGSETMRDAKKALR